MENEGLLSSSEGGYLASSVFESNAQIGLSATEGTTVNDLISNWIRSLIRMVPVGLEENPH
jgi:hypothetical protein